MAIFIHPGFLKTATKTLQEHLFDLHPEIHSLGYPHDDHRKTLLSDALRRIDGVNYADEEVRGLVDELLHQGSPAGTVVFSDETLLANAYLRVPIAQRLFSFFPEAQIILTVRNQFDAIQSFYSRHGRMLTNSPKPYADRHITFLNWLEHADKNYPISFLGSVDYWRSIEIYQLIFGQDHIHIFLFEDFVHNQIYFVDQLCELLKIDSGIAKRLLENQHSHNRESVRYQWYTRLQRHTPTRLRKIFGFWEDSHLKMYWHRFLDEGRKASHQIPDEWKIKLASKYRDGNIRLAEKYALPLEKYGYPL